jgi:hypothetical protein
MAIEMLARLCLIDFIALALSACAPEACAIAL